MLNVNRVCTNTINAIKGTVEEMGPALKWFLPHIFAGTICVGLKEQVSLIATKDLVFYNCLALDVATCFFVYKAVMSVWNSKKEEAPPLKNRFIIHQRYNDNYTEREINKLKDECNYWYQQLQHKNHLLNLDQDDQVML